MEALFVVVAELLLVPLILWGLILFELTIGVVLSVVAVLLGRRSASEAVVHRWHAVRRRLLWSLIFVTSGLLLADLVFFDNLVAMALGSVDDREDLDLSYADAEGSFILGRVELHHLQLSGVRGGAEPSSAFELEVETLVIDIDTAALLTADFAVEEISLDGVVASFDRLRARERAAESGGLHLARDFSVERLHLGEVELLLRDHTGEELRELEVALVELDIGPLDSQSAAFDLLHRSRGQGAVEGYPFVLTTVAVGAEAETTLEVAEIPLEAFARELEKSAGLRATGTASLVVHNRYRDGPTEPRVELDVKLRLHDLGVVATDDMSLSTKLMLGVAERALADLGDDFPLSFGVTVLESELSGVRSFAESGIVERVSDAIANALHEQLQSPPP